MNISWQRIYRALPALNVYVISNFLLYCISTIFVRGISFFMLPFILHKISPTQYGTLSLLTAFITIMTALLGLGLRQVLSIEYFHAHEPQRCSIIHDMLFLYTSIALPTLLLVWYARTIIIHTFFFNAITTSQLLATLIIISTFFYIELMYQLLNYAQAIKYVVLLQCIIALLNTGSILISVFYLENDITGIIWSQAITHFIAFIVSIIYFLSYYAIQFKCISYKHIRYYLWYGFPFIPTILANWLLSSGDRWVLGYFATMHDVGIYAVADLASQLFYAVILQSWGASYLPYMMKRYQENQNNLSLIEHENQRIMWISMIGCAVTISFGFPLAYLIIPNILPTCYVQALHYVWILLMGQICLLGSYFAAIFIQYNKCIYFLAFALFIPALLNIILNCIMIPWWGIMGCSIATLISYAIYFAITYWYNRKLMNYLSLDTIVSQSLGTNGKNIPQSVRGE